MSEEKPEDKKTTFTEHAKKTIDKIKKNASLNIMKPVISRVKTRVRELQKLSQAVHTKIPIGNTHKWYTEPPKMFICGLHASMNNGVGTISYQKYKSETGPDGDVKKRLVVTKKEVYDEKTGEKKDVVVNANYEFDKLIVETIKYRKAIHTEEYDQDGPAI